MPTAATREGILSPIPGGSGAIQVHRALARGIPGYRLHEYSRWRQLCPPLIAAACSGPERLAHVGVDYASLAARRGRVLVGTFHNYVLDAWMARHSTFLQRLHYRTDLRWFLRRGLARCEVVTAVGEATAALVREDLGYAGEIRVIPNGVDLGRFQPRAPGTRDEGVVRVLFSGNATRRKGVDLLVPIAERLAPGIEIVVASGLSGRDEALRHPRIRWLGRVPPERMPALYRDSDLLLMPTVREGMSLSALEAMASGLPIVTSDVPSMAEIVQDGSGGRLCPLAQADGYAQALNALAADAPLRVAMGRYNRARAEQHHDEAVMVARYRDLFEACGKPPARGNGTP